MNKTSQHSPQSFSRHFIFLRRGIERKKKRNSSVFNVFWETLPLLEVYFIGSCNRQLNKSLRGLNKLWGTSPSNRRCKRTSRWQFKILSHPCYITILFICKRAVKSKEAATICKKHKSRLARVPHTITCTLTHSHTHRQISSQPVNRHTSVSVVCGREPEYLEEAQMKHSGAPQTGVRSRSRSRTATCKCDGVDMRRLQVPECIIYLFVATRFLSALSLVKLWLDAADGGHNWTGFQMRWDIWSWEDK